MVTILILIAGALVLALVKAVTAWRKERDTANLLTSKLARANIDSRSKDHAIAHLQASIADHILEEQRLTEELNEVKSRWGLIRKGAQQTVEALRGRGFKSKKESLERSKPFRQLEAMVANLQK